MNNLVGQILIPSTQIFLRSANMKVKVVVELTEKEMQEVVDTIKQYNMGLTPRELIMERVDTDFWDYIDFDNSEIKVVS